LAPRVVTYAPHGNEEEETGERRNARSPQIGRRRLVSPHAVAGTDDKCTDWHGGFGGGRFDAKRDDGRRRAGMGKKNTAPARPSVVDLQWDTRRREKNRYEEKEGRGREKFQPFFLRSGGLHERRREIERVGEGRGFIS
jgi:hypothetical protein